MFKLDFFKYGFNLDQVNYIHVCLQLPGIVTR